MHTHLSFKTQLRMSSLTIIPFTLLQMYHSSFALLNNTLQKKKKNQLSRCFITVYLYSSPDYELYDKNHIFIFAASSSTGPSKIKIKIYINTNLYMHGEIKERKRKRERGKKRVKKRGREGEKNNHEYLSPLTPQLHHLCQESQMRCRDKNLQCSSLPSQR